LNALKCLQIIKIVICKQFRGGGEGGGVHVVPWVGHITKSSVSNNNGYFKSRLLLRTVKDGIYLYYWKTIFINSFHLIKILSLALYIYLHTKRSNIILNYLQYLTPKYAHIIIEKSTIFYKTISISLIKFFKYFPICPPNRNLAPLTRSNLMWDYNIYNIHSYW